MSKGMDRKAFGRRVALLLRQLSAAEGLSQAEVAERLDVSIQAIGNWKRGKDLPALDHLIALADLGGVPIDWLLRDLPGNYPQLSPKASRRDQLEFLAAFRKLLEGWEIRRRRR